MELLELKGNTILPRIRLKTKMKKSLMVITSWLYMFNTPMRTFFINLFSRLVLNLSLLSKYQSSFFKILTLRSV